MKTFIFFIFWICPVSWQAKIVIVQDESSDVHEQYVNFINASISFLKNDNAGNTGEIQAVSLHGSDGLHEKLCFEIDSPDSIVISLTTNQQDVDKIRQFADITGVPTFRVTDSNKRWKYGGNEAVSRQFIPNYVNVINPKSVFYNVLPVIVDTLNLTECAVFYDENFDSDFDDLNQVFNNLNLQNYTFNVMEKNATILTLKLNELNYNFIGDIILMGSMKNVQEFANNVKQDGVSKLFNWYIVTTDISPYLCDTCSLTNTLWTRPDIDTRFTHFDRFQDYVTEKLEHREWLIASDQITLSFYYDLTKVVYSILTSMTNATSIQESGNFTCSSLVFNETRLPLLEAIFQDGKAPSGRFGHYCKDGNETLFPNIHAVMSNIMEDKKTRHVKTVGNWSSVSGLDEIYGSLRVNLSMTNYSIVIAEAPPFIEAYKDADGNTQYRGYCMDLIKFLQEELGFDYTIYHVKDSLYGSMTDRGEWNGLVRDLINGHADMAVADLSVTAERENYVDFTVPYYDLVGVTILMRKDEVEYSLFKFMTVLTPPVWFCIVAAYFFTSFVMWLFDKYSPYGPKEEAKFTFTQCLWYCMTALTPQGGPEAPKNISCKLVAATWWLFGFIIIASYTANLAAFLTVSRMETTIQSLDDLSQQYKIKYAPVKGTASEAYFKRMATIEQRFYDIWKAVSMNETMTPQERASLAVWDYPVSDKYTNMWRFMLANGLPNSSLEAINMVLQSPSSSEGFAYIGDATGIRYAVMTDCRLQPIGGEFNRKPYAIAVQQLSPLKDILSGTILKLSSDRKLEDLKDKWWKNNPNKVTCPEVESESSGISVKNIAGVFLVILGGIVFSIVTLIFEYFCIKRKEAKTATAVSTDGNNGNVAIEGIGNANNEHRKIRKKKIRSSNKVISVKAIA